MERKLAIAWTVSALLLLVVATTLVYALEAHRGVQRVAAQLAESRSNTVDVRKIRAREVEVIDDKGEVSVYMNGSKGQIDLLTESKVPSVTLAGRGVGSIGMAIYDGSGLSANLHAGYLHLGGMFAEPSIPSVSLSVLDGSSVEVADRQGFRTVMGENDLKSARGDSVHTSAATLYMFNKDGSIVWRAPFGPQAR